MQTVANEAFFEAERDSTRSSRTIGWALALSILNDIVATGGMIRVRDSRILVSWPDWSTEDGQRGLRSALVRLQSETRRPTITPQILESFTDSLDGASLLRILSEGDIRLIDTREDSTEGAPPQQIFAAAAASWTMPVRDREGRNRRFILQARHAALSANATIGILEVGDGAPHSTQRDELLGLTPHAFSRWIATSASPAIVLLDLHERLIALRKALKECPGFDKAAPLPDLYARLDEIEQRAAGRSRDSRELPARKRLTYLARMTRAENAVRLIREGAAASPKDLYALVRLLRDLAIPRTHLEITLCGGIPPFASALAGKLVVAFAADPRVLSICTGSVGAILRTVFEPNQLQSLLPNSGAVLLTTKGLFAEHSAQYTRATLPGENGVSLPLRKIGVTSGVTASLMSRRSYQLAQDYLAITDSRRAVSDEFGSGGSKRQRRIEAAVKDLGLPDQLIHPKLQRPIYAASLASNIEDVAILNRPPRWQVATPTNPEQYAHQAVAHWRRKWWPTIARRISGATQYPGLRAWLDRGSENA